MNYLLDTHVLLWFLTANCEKLSQNCQKILLDDDNQLYFSVASIWEMSIKYTLGRPDFQYNPKEIVDELLNMGFVQLAIDVVHLYALSYAFINRR